MSLGRPVMIAENGLHEMQTTASELGLPRGLFPQKFRMRDENNVPRWFERKRFDKDGSAIYVSGEYTMTVVDDQKGGR